MKLRTIAAAAIAFSLLLSACSSDDAPSGDTLESIRAVGVATAQSNARAYSLSVHGNGAHVVTQSDSTVSSSCPYGDGWASVKVTTDAGEFGLKCQTFGSTKGTKGCLSDEEFATKSFAEQNGKCDEELAEEQRNK